MKCFSIIPGVCPRDKRESQGKKGIYIYIYTHAQKVKDYDSGLAFE